MSNQSSRPDRPPERRAAEPPAPRARTGIDAGAETELNMTPMIDIVFQLIIFFLLSLKFKTVDERIDTNLPNDCGLISSPRLPDDSPRVKLKLFRRHRGEPGAYTAVKLDNSHELRLPEGPWVGGAEAEDTLCARYEAVRTGLLSVIREKWAAVGNDPRMRAEIATPPPGGGSVPHGDAIFVLDTLVEAGLTNVRFEGQVSPLKP